MATKPYFLWGGDRNATSLAALNTGEGIFKSSALETAPDVATAASDTALVPPELGSAAVARPRLRPDSSSRHEKKMKQQAGGGAVGAKKPPQKKDVKEKKKKKQQARERKQGPAETEAPAKKDVREIEFFPAAKKKKQQARERKQGPAETEAPAKKDVREIEFFPAASANHTGGGGRVSVPGESELTAPFSSSYGAAASHTAPQLDLSLRL